MPDEHARVPAVVAAGDVLGRPLGIGLLDEALRAVEARGGAEIHQLAGLDVAEAGRGIGRGDADGHDVRSLRGGGEAVAQRLAEGLDVGHELVGREDRRHALRIAGGDEAAGQRAGGRRVAGLRLADQVFLRQLPRDAGRRLQQVGRSDDQRSLRRHHALEAFERQRDQGSPAEERDELLRARRRAEGPEALAAPAGKDDRIVVYTHVVFLWYSKSHPIP